MKRAETMNKERRLLRFGSLDRHIACILVLALLVAALPKPASAAFQDKSGSLPGFASTGAIIGAGVAAAVVIGLVIYFKIHHKEVLKLQVDHVAAKFDDLPAGQSADRTIPIINRMSEPIKITSVTVDYSSGSFQLAKSASFPRDLAAMEGFAIPVTVSANHSGGTAHIRIVATSDSFKKEGVENLKVAYGHKKSKFAKLIP
jgi:hypothetical protein